jgi:hypothetical protein
MSIRRMRWLLAALLFTAVSAKADSVYVNGSFAFADHGAGVGPYGGTLNGQNASFYCVDFGHQISGNTGWTANSTSLLSASGYSNTYLQNQTTYLEMAWLITQMLGTSSHTLQAQYQWAIWYLSVGSNLNLVKDPYGKDAFWAAAAATAVLQNHFTVSGWEILTPTPKGSYGQEFIVIGTPESSSLLLLGFGLICLAGLGLRK